MRNYVYFIYILIFLPINSMGQNIKKLKEGELPAKATLQEVAWIAGYWKGEALGGHIEEIWSNPLGDSMMFAFKLVKNDKVSFYELGAITQTEESLLFQLKHFDSNFRGWESKDESIKSALVSITPNAVYFENFTFEKVNHNEMNVYVLFKQKDREAIKK